MFSGVSQERGASVFSDKEASKLSGLSYEIRPEKSSLYQIHIDSWQYDIHNGPQGRPVLEFVFQGLPDPAKEPEKSVRSLKTLGCPIIRTERSILRAAMATVFFINQVLARQVPDAEKILRMYRIHPSQNRLYRPD